MTISSRTPEGWPARCPTCGKAICVEPSMPGRDATCPHCGCLVWLSRPTTDTKVPSWMRRIAVVAVAIALLWLAWLALTWLGSGIAEKIVVVVIGAFLFGRRVAGVAWRNSPLKKGSDPLEANRVFNVFAGY